MVAYDSRDAGLPRGLCKGGYGSGRLAWASPFACVKPNRRGGALAGSIRCWRMHAPGRGFSPFPPRQGNPACFRQDRRGESLIPLFPCRSSNNARTRGLSAHFSRRYV